MADHVDSFCFTDANNSKKTTFAWTIKNYDASSCENLESPTFESITHDGRKLQWQLSLHSAAGYQSRSINPRLKLKSVIEGSVTVVFTFYLINNKKEKVHVKTRRDDFKRLNSESWPGELFEESDLKDSSKGLLVDGCFTIYCILSLPSDVVHVSGSRLYSVPSCDIVSHLESAMTEGLLSDFTLAVGEKEFQVHKLILSIRSPVFKRMIECPMAESANSRVEISDFEPEVVEEMIHYMYTGKAPHLNNNYMVEPLFNIADKYELLRLKEMCAKVLAKHLDVENAAATLVLAELHNMSKLKTICMNFIGAHLSAVAKTPQWSALKSQQRGLYAQFLESLARVHSMPEEVLEDFKLTASAHEPPRKRQRRK